jgi:tight adherence protein B
MLVRSLRAGHPVMTGINLVAQEMPDPIGTEFGLVFDEMSYGLDIRESLEKMASRLKVLEIDYMVVAIRVQQGTGGSLAEILTSFVSVMRQRQLLHAKVKAVSAEARLSAKILGGLPIVVVGAITLINPHYYDEAKTNPGLAYVLGGAALLALTGILLLRRVTNIRV